MKVFWFFFCIAAAFVWFSFALGFMEAPPWTIPFAFAMLGLGSVVEAMKALLPEQFRLSPDVRGSKQPTV